MITPPLSICASPRFVAHVDLATFLLAGALRFFMG
jgi:hypothetical protein